MSVRSKTIGLVLGIVVVTLFAANIAASFVRREERPIVPTILLGKWRGSEGEATLDVREKQVIVRKGSRRHICNLGNVILYYDGAFLSYLFGEQKIAVACDKDSTRRYQSTIDFRAPDDYRKAYYFSVPDVSGWIHVEETVYMSKGYDDSEGTYVWTLSHFYR